MPSAFLPLFISLFAAACAALSGCARQPTGTSVPLLYVSDETGGAVVVVDPAAGTIVDRIPVGKRPRGIRFTRDGRHLLVALSGSPISPPGVDESTLPPPDRSADGIGLVSLEARKLLRIIPSGQDPETFDLSPDGKTIYVSNEETAEMSVIDMETGRIVKRIHVGNEPEGVTVSPDGRVVYVACEADNQVVAIHTATLTLAGVMRTGARPRSIVFSADGALAFVTAENQPAVTVLDAREHRMLSNIFIGGYEGVHPRPMGAVLSPTGTKLYVSLGRGGEVATVDVATLRREGGFSQVGTRPWGIAISADGRELYTANGPSGDVSVIDVGWGRVRRIVTGGSPWGVVVSR